MQNPGCSRIAQIAHNVDVEEIFKGPSLEGPRFQVCHVHAVIEKVSQDVVQSAWPVLGRQDQGNLIGLRRLFHIGGDDEEPRVVHGIIIDVFHLSLIHI